MSEIRHFICVYLGNYWQQQNTDDSTQRCTERWPITMLHLCFYLYTQTVTGCEIEVHKSSLNIKILNFQEKSQNHGSWWLRKKLWTTQTDFRQIPWNFFKKPKEHLYWLAYSTALSTHKGQMTAENTAKDHTNTGLIIMCRIFSDIITISFNLHFKWTLICRKQNSSQKFDFFPWQSIKLHHPANDCAAVITGHFSPSANLHEIPPKYKKSAKKTNSAARLEILWTAENHEPYRPLRVWTMTKMHWIRIGWGCNSINNYG